MVKVLALHARDPIWAPLLSRQPRFPSSSLPVAWESSRGQPKALEPYSSVAEVEEALGTWLQTGEALAIAADWGVSQQMIDLPLCLSSSLYI